MNREVESDALRRKASAAGLLVGLLLLLLASMVVLVVIGFWPVFATFPITKSSFLRLSLTAFAPLRRFSEFRQARWLAK